MNSLGIWSIVMIIYQSAICMLISWLTLSCRFVPDSSELHEVILMKLLYLYDPEACGRIHFYNFTITRGENTIFSTVMWPVRNPIASRFRSAMQIWLSLHIIWLALSIVNLTHARRPCGFYAVVVPFTLTGLAVLVTDVVFMAMFIEDIPQTDTEIGMLDFMNGGGKNLRWIVKKYPWQTMQELGLSTLDDTSWIALLFAFASCRGIVQWILNFWLVKDNYFAGLDYHRKLQKEISVRRDRVLKH
ncbi:uncharacterized protein LOC125056899 [Pieris napi]|uniref:uncharacterized protein LOC125056899 n=1 Tax=Pieris napi TaxID=78633 RepID=UPI001FBAF0F0|nr:uncharacterized protein LOC125056899 [Pieris napi]